MKVLLASGFFESELPSFREYSYSKELASMGHDVTLMCGDRSYVWSRSRVRLPQTQPSRNDRQFADETGVKVLRRKVFFRISDFVLYWPVIEEIRRADVVHVIEFRQGITLLIAVIARLFGKPVVYDHEQRGDRTGRWYSRVDSLFRRMLIFCGSFLVDCMRHTVLANRDHFRSCTPRRVREMFAPLGVDPQRFYFDADERARTRAELQVERGERLAIMSGKLHASKRVAEVVVACRRAGVRLLLVGTMTPEVADAIAAMPKGNEILLPQAPADRLRALYNAADIAIFTTFSVSYWEAHATGLHLIVPQSEFTQTVFADDPSVTRFGEPAMFVVPDEEYVSTYDVASVVHRALSSAREAERTSRVTFSARDQCQRLASLYGELVAARS